MLIYFFFETSVDRTGFQICSVQINNFVLLFFLKFSFFGLILRFFVVCDRQLILSSFSFDILKKN